MIAADWNFDLASLASLVSAQDSASNAATMTLLMILEQTYDRGGLRRWSAMTAEGRSRPGRRVIDDRMEKPLDEAIQIVVGLGVVACIIAVRALLKGGRPRKPPRF